MVFLIVFKPFYGKYPAYDIEFSDEDDTLGNLLQDSIYRSVKDWKSEDKENKADQENLKIESIRKN